MYMAGFGMGKMYCTVYGRVWYGRNVEYMAGFGMAEI
jgi:hypothetical protein